jgi:hypothetical protein
MNNPLVFQVLGGALVLFFIFLLVMCWKTWRFTHIFFAFLTFAGCITFLIFASFVLKTQNAWRTHFEAYTKEIEKAEAEELKYVHGDLLEVDQGKDSIRGSRAGLSRVVTDRGRVWRECTPLAAVDTDTLRVRTVPASLPQNATPTPNGIAPQTILYVFAEAEVEGWKVPVAYLGEFSVDAATESEVTMSATLPSEPDQVQRIGQAINSQGRDTWALYEIMPLDGHEVFAEMDADGKMLVGMDKEQLAKYIPDQFNWPPNFDWSPEKYQQFLDQYYRFNREADDDDPPENTWVLVKFVKAHQIVVDSDAEQSLLEGDGRYFDSSGRAVEGRVRRGEDGAVEFEVGDTAVFDLDTAENDLIAQGICEKVKTVYRRSLHDYERFFREARFRHIDLDNSIARVNREVATLRQVKAKADMQVDYRSKEKAQLEMDLKNFAQERAEATAYAQALAAQWRNTLQQLSLLYRENNRLVDELTRLQYRMAQEINRRTLEATAQVTTPTTTPR